MNMDDEHQLLTERERGTLAQQIVENPVFMDAWESCADNLRAHMENPSVPDEVVLEARRGLLILNRVRAAVEEAMTTGKMASIQLDERSHNESATSH